MMNKNENLKFNDEKIKQRWKKVKTNNVEWVWVFNTGREEILPSPQRGLSDPVSPLPAHIFSSSSLARAQPRNYVAISCSAQWWNLSFFRLVLSCSTRWSHREPTSIFISAHINFSIVIHRTWLAAKFFLVNFFFPQRRPILGILEIYAIAFYIKNFNVFLGSTWQHSLLWLTFHIAHPTFSKIHLLLRLVKMEIYFLIFILLFSFQHEESPWLWKMVRHYNLF